MVNSGSSLINNRLHIVAARPCWEAQMFASDPTLWTRVLTILAIIGGEILIALLGVWYFKFRIKTKIISVKYEDVWAMYYPHDNLPFKGDFLFYGHHRVRKDAEFIRFEGNGNGIKYLLRSGRIQLEITTRDNKLITLLIDAIGQTDNLFKVATSGQRLFLPTAYFLSSLRGSFVRAGKEFSYAELMDNRKAFLDRVGQIYIERGEDNILKNEDYCPFDLIVVNLERVTTPEGIQLGREELNLAQLREGRQVPVPEEASA